MVQVVDRPAEERPAPVREPLTMKSLLEAGVHFGHQTRRWNPQMKRYIFTQRNGIHIIDLQQTLGLMNEAYRAMIELVADGGKVLFVGTKRQAQEVVQSEAERCGMWYVNQRWLGGTLTNFQTIRTRINYMLDLQQKRDQGYFRRLRSSPDWWPYQTAWPLAPDPAAARFPPPFPGVLAILPGRVCNPQYRPLFRLSRSGSALP